MMNFTVAVPLLSLCLTLMLGIGGCTTLLLGKSYHGFHDERHRRVITDTTAMLERNPNDAELYVARGKAYYCRLQYKEALSDFNRAIGIDSENAAAYRLRGITSKIVDFQALEVKTLPYTHKGYEADTKKADILEPRKLDEEINQGFGYISNITNEFIYPVTGDCVAESYLILGSTTTTQVAEMLPPPQWPGIGTAIYPVYKPTKSRIGKVGKVVDNARYRFTPEKPWRMELVFDINDKLVVIWTIDSMTIGFGDERQRKIGRKRLEKYRDLMRQHQFVEVYKVYRDTGDTMFDKKTLRAEITPCVTVDIAVPLKPQSTYVIYSVEYIYTCPTK